MMTVHRLILGNRAVIVGSPDDGLPTGISAPFAVLVPAYSEQELEGVLRRAGDLLTTGCIEFCCVGPEAERLHDALDDIIEEHGVLNVITTWHTDEKDACDYFVFGAGGTIKSLLALVSFHPELVELLALTAREN